MQSPESDTNGALQAGKGTHLPDNILTVTGESVNSPLHYCVNSWEMPGLHPALLLSIFLLQLHPLGKSVLNLCSQITWV